MPEPIPTPTAGSPAGPAGGLTGSVADPRVTTGGRADATATGARPAGADRYALLDEIARGGMGVIYRATDAALGREVAVKVLHERFAPDSGTARRFADEARIAAQLQHPGIPPVHDLGTLPDGRPFLAMKLIKGRTLEDLLAARPDVATERGRFVATFEAVCQALAYAHAHGVIHRDLKPANVMVGSFGEVQVMDWGLAKVLGTQPAEGSAAEETAAGTLVVSLRDSDGAFTQAGSVLGTPAFMPPEQAVGAVGKVDRRSDVFGLGAILAVILTGRPPFAAASAETTRVKAAQGDVAECLARLNACGAEPELVALCKRCLAPRPADRPADAGEVARAVAELRAAADERARRAELERAQAGARSLERRRRRRLWAGSVAALALAAIAGLSAVLAVQARANHELEAKNRELADEQAKVEQRNRELAEEQAKVQARFELAQKAIATFHTGVSKDVLLRNDQFKELRNRLLKEAAGFYGDLGKLLEDQPDVRSRELFASGYFQLADLTETIGSKPDALAGFRRALAAYQRLADDHPGDAGYQTEMVRTYRRIAFLMRDTGEFDGAQEAQERALAISRKLADIHPELAEYQKALAESHHMLGRLLYSRGKLAESLPEYEKALGILRKVAAASPSDVETQDRMATAHLNIGTGQSQTAKRADALVSYQEAASLWEKLVVAKPSESRYQRLLAVCYGNIGLLLGSEEAARALGYYQKSLAIRQKLAADNPAVIEAQRDLAWCHSAIGQLLSHTGRPRDALAAYEKALSIRQKLAADNPDVVEFQSDLANTVLAVGMALKTTGQPVEAMEAYRRALAIRQKLADTHPSVTLFQSDLAINYQAIGRELSETGKQEEALESYGKALAVQQQLVDANPAVTRFQAELAASHQAIGRVYVCQKRLEAALAASDKGVALRQKLAEADPANTGYAGQLGASYALRGAAHARAGHPAEAAADLRRALALWAENKTPDSEDHFEQARALALLAGLAADAKSGVKAADAAAFADQAVAALKAAVAAGWADPAELKETDFDPLRTREDFRRLLTGLEQKSAADRPKDDAPAKPEK